MAIRVLRPLQLVVLHELKERNVSQGSLSLPNNGSPKQKAQFSDAAWKLSNHRMTLFPLIRGLEESVFTFYLIIEPCLGFF